MKKKTEDRIIRDEWTGEEVGRVRAGPGNSPFNLLIPPSIGLLIAIIIFGGPVGVLLILGLCLISAYVIWICEKWPLFTIGEAWWIWMVGAALMTAIIGMQILSFNQTGEFFPGWGEMNP